VKVLARLVQPSDDISFFSKFWGAMLSWPDSKRGTLARALATCLTSILMPTGALSRLVQRRATTRPPRVPGVPGPVLCSAGRR
jgi:hypothetical protein